MQVKKPHSDCIMQNVYIDITVHRGSPCFPQSVSNLSYHNYIETQEIILGFINCISDRGIYFQVCKCADICIDGSCATKNTSYIIMALSCIHAIVHVPSMATFDHMVKSLSACSGGTEGKILLQTWQCCMLLTSRPA